MALWLAASVLIIAMAYFILVPAVDRYFAASSERVSLDTDSYLTFASLPIVRQ